MKRTLLLNTASGDLNNRLVSIDSERITGIAWPTKQNGGMTIDLSCCDPTSPSSALEFLVVMGSLNFRFWSVNADGALQRYTRGTKTGARALWSAFEEHWEGDAKEFFKRLKSPKIGFSQIFGDIPEPLDRVDILESIEDSGELSTFCRELTVEIVNAKATTLEHASALAEVFPLAFRDPYLKKAQLALSMYTGFLRNQGHHIDTSDLVAFADYQVPRVLRALGVLQYSSNLATLVDGGTFIAEDSPEERAIRSATIVACEHIAQTAGATAADVDNWLWQSQNIAGASSFHLTPTTRY